MVMNFIITKLFFDFSHPLLGSPVHLDEDDNLEDNDDNSGKDELEEGLEPYVPC